MGKLVLLVDDDKLLMQLYVGALERKGYKVKHCFEPDSALAFVKENGRQIDAIILDVMMPPRKPYENEDTNGGLKTGIFLLRDLRKYCPNVPVVVLTNIRDPETLDELGKDPEVEVVRKFNCPPFELVDLITQKILNAKRPRRDEETCHDCDQEEEGEEINAG